MSLFLVIQAAIGTPATVGLISIIAFGVVYAIRKFAGKQWDKAASVIPALNFDLTPGLVILSKFVQALPATIVAAAIGAVASGGALTPTLLAALAGPLAALGHEMLKAFPVPYTGATANVLSAPKPTGPFKLKGTGTLTSGTLTSGMLCLMLFGCGVTSIPEPCTPAQKADIVAKYAAEEVAQCSAFSSLQECPAFDTIKADRAKEDAKCR